MITGRYRSVGDLVDRSGLPEAEIRCALEQLRKLNLLRPFGDGVGRLADPHLGLRSLLLQQISEIELALADFEEDRTAVLTLLDRYDDLYPGGEIGEYVIGPDAVLDRLRKLAERTTTEWLAFVPDGAQSVTSLETTYSLELQVRRRGVAARTVYTASIRNDVTASRQRAGTAGRASWWDEFGDRVRTAPSLPVHMVVIDRSVAVLPVDPRDPWSSVVLISAPGVLAALLALFERVWESAVPLGRPTPPDEHGLSPQEKELLGLLSQGLTDDVIRRRLGVSLRTVRRMAADLFARLGANSRFEAGYRAAKRGWI
ncbi:helix-turn-helix transcriptional regulator [Streptomyces hiroshimensis]|nr:LuxR C-terminal-related transcriptional regulator [Streptomyces hiroshimensis]